MRFRWILPRLLAAAVWVTASAVGCVSVAGQASASPGPAVHVDTRSAILGELIHITGSGWSPVGQTVQMELCGQDALNPGSDCDQANQYTAAIRAGGVFYGALTVRRPPSPCPCVVVVTNQGGFSGIDVPITIAGVPTAAIPKQAAPTAPVALSAKVLSPISPAAWFGGPRAVTLVLRVKNMSSIAFESPTLSVRVGRGKDPSGFVLAEPLAPLAVGATQVMRIPVTLPAVTLGGYSVRAQVITGQGQVATMAGTSTYPWGLFIAMALAVQAVLLLLRNRVRARLQRPSTAEMPTEDPTGEGAAEAVSVIDLRTPSLPRAGAWTTTHRLALLLPERNLTCSVEVLACPAIKLHRTAVRAWDDFATSPWDALHESSLWAGTAADSSSSALLVGETFAYHGRGFGLELHLSAAGPELRLGDSRTVVPVRIQGSVSFDGTVSAVDIQSTLEQTWGTDPADDVDSAAAEPPSGSLTYAHTADGDSFYLLLAAGEAPAGWLVRDGRASSIVHADRRVEARSGPYPRRITVDLTDSLGRRAHASGTAANGMALRDSDGLVLDCRTEWDLDGVPAVGEDRSKIDIETWRSTTRAAWNQLADASR